MNDLNENTLNPNCFEKTKEAWGIFSFFSSTNVETKNVCPIAYNVGAISSSGLRTINFQNMTMIINSTNFQTPRNPLLLIARVRCLYFLIFLGGLFL